MPDSDMTGMERVAALKAKVDEAIGYYRKLQAMDIPDLAVEVGDDLDVATEKLVPKLDKRMLAKWRTRASKIERINEALADFEYGTIESLIVSNSTVLLKEIHNVFRKFEWVLGHYGEIALLLASSLGWASVRYGSEVSSAFSKVGSALATGFDDLTTKLSGLADVDLSQSFDALTDKLADAAIVTSKAISFVISSAVLGLLAAILESAIAAFASTNYLATLIPLRAVKAATEQALMNGAFPQGSKRVRRRKTHRFRA